MQTMMEQPAKLMAELWYDCRDYTTAELDNLQTVFNGSYSTILINANTVQLCEKFPQRITIAAECSTIDECTTIMNALQTMGKELSFAVSGDEGLLGYAAEQRIRPVLYTEVNDRAQMENAARLTEKYDFMIIEFKDETNIPLELLLAQSQKTKTKIFKRVFSSEDGFVSSQVMEQGSDGVLLSNKSVEEIINMNNRFNSSRMKALDLVEMTVTEVKHTDMGDRVCVDTTSNLTQKEGMIIGSTSQGGILVCSETHMLPYMNLRPFRVNAGGLHSYVWGPGDVAVYLSDLRAGDKVLAVASDGATRVVTVGRVKIERRPLLCIKAEYDGKEVNVFVQDDWHVRITGKDGEIRNATTIKPGDKLLGYLSKPGRHLGIAIDETIEER